MPARKAVTVADALGRYLAEMQTYGLAKNTLAAQSGYLKRFGEVCADVQRERAKRSPLTMTTLDTGVIAAYFATCAGGQGTMNNMTTPLRKFLDWAEMNQMISSGASRRLMLGRKRKKFERAPKHYVAPEQFDVLLSVAGERHPAERMAMAVALYTLARRSEIMGLTLGQVHQDRGEIELYRAKRKRWTVTGITPELDAELNRWLPAYAQAMGLGVAEMVREHPGWKLVPRLLLRVARDEKGRLQPPAVAGFDLDPLNSPSRLEYIVKRGLDATGAQTTDGKHVRHRGEGMHTIRRSGARAMLKNLSEGLGFDRALLQVATMLDHEDTQQTLAYIGMNEEREQLNEWLRSNSMYGGKPVPSNVVRLRRAG